MSLKTVPVRVVARCPDDTPAAGAQFEALLVDALGRRLASSLFDGDTVVPLLATAPADDGGSGVLRLWPNARGGATTYYQVLARMGTITVPIATISVPDTDTDVEIPIALLAVQAPFPAASDAQAALQQLTALAAAATSAEARAAEAAGLALEIFGSTTAISEAIATLSAQANTASAQASLASGYAMAAASVAQQDLSGVNGAPLHRGPAPIADLRVYDTSKDSDGGAWVGRVDASYLYEALNGAWIGSANGVDNELMARALGGSLGPNLLSSNSVADWTPGVNNTMSAGASGGVRATSSLTSARMTRTFTGLTVGKVYLLYWPTLGTNAVNPFIRAGSAVSTFDYVATNTTFRGGVFRATTPDLFLDVYTGASGNGVYVEQAGLMVREVQAFAPSGAYYQSAADGKFYRLFRNLLPFTSKLNSWTKAGVTVTENTGAVAAPDGTFTASKVVETNASGAHTLLSQGAGNATNAATGPLLYTGVVWLRAAERSRAFVNVASGSNVYFAADINLTTGAVNATGNPNAGAVTCAVTAESGGWWKVVIRSYWLTNVVGLYMAMDVADNTEPFAYGARTGHAGDGVSGIYVWRPHVEVGDNASPVYEDKPDATSTSTETFRGNKARFPRVAAFVIEAGRAVVYDLLEPGRPMWMVLPSAGLSSTSMLAAATLTCATALEGRLYLGSTTLGVLLVDFAADAALDYTGQVRRFAGNIAQRQLALGLLPITPGGALGSNAVNAVSACSVPSAPVNPVTGLQVPLLAAFTAGGVALLLPDDSIVRSASTSNYISGTVTPYMLHANVSGGTSFQTAMSPLLLGSSFALNGSGLNIISSAWPGMESGRRNLVARRSGNIFSRCLLNEMLIGGPITNEVTGLYTTGIMCADIRRVLMSDVNAGVANGAEKLQDPTFDSGTGWTLGNTGAGPAATISGGVLSSTRNGDGTAVGNAVQSFATTPGKTYQAVLTGAAGGTMNIRVGTGSMLSDITASSITVGAQPVTVLFTATGATTFVSLFNSSNGTTATLDSCSVKEIVPDRCYKNKPATVVGTLTKTVVASGAQLVFYGGFNASNYVQEAYSGDLDAGVNPLYVSFFGDIPANVSAPGWAFDRSAASGAFFRMGHDAAGKLTASVSDGTTTRAVTTTAAYNTGVPFSAGLLYETSGTVSIVVNGRRVASATGAPLGSMSNGAAVLTLGIDRSLSSPWAGGLALVKFGMTAPSDDALDFAYQEERQMFRAGAQVTLPDTGSVIDMSYDPDTRRWRVASSTNESEFFGLVRVATSSPAAGTISKVAGRGGTKLVARAGANPGVDVTMPPQNLKEDLLRRAEELIRLQVPLPPLDWSGAFTATIINGSCLATISGASLQLPSGATLQGARVGGTGVAAGATVLAVNGNQVQLSAPCTATNASATITIQDLILPPGQSPHLVCTSGAAVQEGTGKVWNRAFDGFRERVAFGTPPGNLWIQVETRRAT